MVANREKKKRMFLLTITLASIFPTLLLVLFARIPLYGDGESVFAGSAFLVVAFAVGLISILWAAKAIKTLNSIYPVVFTTIALYLTADFVRAISLRAAEAAMEYLIALDNDIVLVMRIILLYIGYLVLVALVGLVVRMYVGLGMVLVIALASSALPILIYVKVLPDKVKARLNDVAYALVIALVLVIMRYAISAFISIL